MISLKKYYKQCCKILANVIKEAKKYTYNNQINKSTNKIKTTWNIIKKETNRHKEINKHDRLTTILLRPLTITF
jgi:hypothetical protein